MAHGVAGQAGPAPSPQVGRLRVTCSAFKPQGLGWCVGPEGPACDAGTAHARPLSLGMARREGAGMAAIMVLTRTLLNGTSTFS